MSEDDDPQLTTEDVRFLRRLREQSPSRRDFLKYATVGAAAAGAGSALSGGASAQPTGDEGAIGESNDRVEAWLSEADADELTTASIVDRSSGNSYDVDGLAGGSGESFISGFLLEYVSSFEISIEPGFCLADDDATTIDSDTTLNVDITTTGAGGRQSGLSEQASSWYEVWVIADSDGSNPAGFLVEESQSFSNPKSVERRIGYIRNDSNSDFFKFYNPEPGLFYWETGANHRALNTDTPAASYTTVDLSDQCPPTSTSAWMRVLAQGDGSTSGSTSTQVVHPDAAAGNQMTAAGWAAHGVRDADAIGKVPVGSGQDVQYNTGGNSQNLILDVVGWVDPR